MPYGSMGGDGQPQFQAAVFTRHARFGMELGEAIDAPRWRLGRSWGGDDVGVMMENRFDPDLVAALERAGHRVALLPDAYDEALGHAGAIVRRPDGRLFGASRPALRRRGHRSLGYRHAASRRSRPCLRRLSGCAGAACRVRPARRADLRGQGHLRRRRLSDRLRQSGEDRRGPGADDACRLRSRSCSMPAPPSSARPIRPNSPSRSTGATSITARR